MGSKIILTVSILSALVFSGCTPKAAVEEDASTDEGVKTLDGIWATECLQDGDGSFVKSVQLAADGNMTIATIRYKDTTVCEQAKINTTVMYSGSMAVKADAQLAGAKNYEWAMSMIVGIPYDQALVDDLNANQSCGSSSWAAGQAGVVMGCLVAPGFDLTNAGYGTVHYGLYKIDESTTPVSMQFESKCSIAGYEDLCPTEGDRPSTLDATVFYKQ